MLIEVFELVADGRDERMHLRVELSERLDRPKHFCARIWRLESYRLQSTLPQVDGSPVHAPSDEIILKEFEGFESPIAEPREFEDAVAAREYVLDEVGKFLETLEYRW